MIKAYYLVLKNVLSFEYFDFSGSFVTHLFYFVIPLFFKQKVQFTCALPLRRCYGAA